MVPAANLQAKLMESIAELILRLIVFSETN